MLRKSWNETFAEMARVISRRSPDPHTQVGAVLVNKDNVIVGMGYNGLPRGCDHSQFPMSRPEKYEYFVHAEANAILNAIQGNLNDCSLYTTLSPCNECAKLIIQKGIKKVYYIDYRDYSATTKLFKHCGVEMQSVN